MERSLNASTISIEDSGSGRAIICLHGLGGGGYFFSQLSDDLKGDFRVVSFDMPGLGRNQTAVESFSIDQCVDFLLELLDREFNEPVSLLGHSMGTIVALKAYARRPKAIASMIFLGGLPEPVDEIKEILANRIEIIGTRGISSASESVMTAIFSDKTRACSEEIVSWYKKMLENNDEATYIQNVKELIAASAVDVVAKITVPCLAITGTEDRYASPENVKQFVSQIPSNAQFEVLQDCGHMIFYEDPTRFSEIVRNFLIAQ